MTSEAIRVTFFNPTVHMFTMGGTTEVSSLRLSDTEEEAIELYKKGYSGVDAIPQHEFEAASAVAEEVEMEAKYGTIDMTFVNMTVGVCKASREHKLITLGPVYNRPSEL